MEREDVFGKRKGIQQSPHIKAQTDLDSNLLWLIAGSTVLMAMFEVGSKSDFKALRGNFRTSDMGRFKESDFN